MTGEATDWSPEANGPVLCITVEGSKIYAGGAFTSIGGQARNYVAELDESGAATDWNPNPDGVVTAIRLSRSRIYVEGTSPQLVRRIVNVLHRSTPKRESSRIGTLR